MKLLELWCFCRLSMRLAPSTLALLQTEIILYLLSLLVHSAHTLQYGRRENAYVREAELV